MAQQFDFVVVGGGSAGAVIASRLSEDPKCRVALIEAGERPPEISALPIAPPAMQLNPATDWMFTADPGKAGLGLNGRRVPVPRGKMLGGSSGINYMMYVRGHPGDFDAWAAGGATGWSYAEVLPYFRKSEGLAASDEIVIDAAAHDTNRVAEWQATGRGLGASSLADAVVFCSSGLGDLDRHDTEIICFLTGGNEDFLRTIINIDTARFFDDPPKRVANDAENLLLLANPVLPHSRGEIVLENADPGVQPAIRMNYYADPHDMKVMVAAIRRTIEIAAHWPGNRKLGPLMVPPFLAEKHGYREREEPSDALLEDFALHFSLTVYHPTSTCRIGDVVDPRLRVNGIERLRVADASVMPAVIGGNTNAPSIMIGEKAAEMIAAEHGVRLAEFVGERG